MNFTKLVLKRPVTAILSIISLLVFGYQAVMKSSLEAMPEMDMAMMIVMTTYSGASPEDVDELITKEIEESVSTLSGLKTISSTSNEGSSMVMLEYDYGTDMNDSYDDLKKQIDAITHQLPDDADTRVIMELNMDSSVDITLAVDHPSVDNLYNYVDEKIVPELKKIAIVAEVDVSGGSEEYIKIELVPEKMEQYNITMGTISEDIGAANLAYPAGETLVGSQELSVSTRMNYETVESLKEIPITTTGNYIVYLEDVANVYKTVAETNSIARYDGEETISVSISRQQSSTAMELSSAVEKTIQTLTAKDSELNIVVVDDNADTISTSLWEVVQTLLMAVGISMVIIWLFFGDLKASLIVGSSIPISILVSLVLMNLMDFSLNTITLSALTLGVGMMVDNSIVVLESCFRMTSEREGGFIEYFTDALEGTKLVGMSILGGTLTTCVVFLPLALLNGLTGQIFKPLGFTMVFCMSASLLSAVTIVPLCYMLYRPKEKSNAPLSKPISELQDVYRDIMKVLLFKRKTVIVVSLSLLSVSLLMATQLKLELMASDDQGEITIEVETRPGLTVAKVDQVLMEVEKIIVQTQDLESYMTTYGGGGIRSSDAASITAYLKKDRTMETTEVVDLWKQELADLPDCNITVDAESSMDMMSSSNNGYEVILKGAVYDEVKEVSDLVVSQLMNQPEVTRIHSDLENSSPVIEIDVDPIKAKAAGLSAAAIGNIVNQMLSGIKAATLDVEGNDYAVRVEYADGEYSGIDQLKSIVLAAPGGNSVALTDVANIHFVDSPASINREDRQYIVTITGDYTELASSATKADLDRNIVTPNLSSTISMGLNSIDISMDEEFNALFGAIAMAVFLIFVVMSAQFESTRFSFMVMTTIPFSLIGAFGLLYITDTTISMVSLLGFLMLIGTVVNNGILYVDTVNQYRDTMDLNTALIEAGATRLRPILMTTLTTVISMIPMAMALGDSGSTTQGLAIVNIGGLSASTLLCLLMLPIYYSLMTGKKQQKEIVNPD